MSLNIVFIIFDQVMHSYFVKLQSSVFHCQSQTPTLELNTSPCRQTFGCGTPHEQWQKSGLHSSGPGKRPSEGQVWSLQPAIGCNVEASDVVEVSGALVVVSVEDISGVVVVSADVVFVILSYY